MLLHQLVQRAQLLGGELDLWLGEEGGGALLAAVAVDGLLVVRLVLSTPEQHWSGGHRAWRTEGVEDSEYLSRQN